MWLTAQLSPEVMEQAYRKADQEEQTDGPVINTLIDGRVVDARMLRAIQNAVENGQGNQLKDIITSIFRGGVLVGLSAARVVMDLKEDA